MPSPTAHLRAILRRCAFCHHGEKIAGFLVSSEYTNDVVTHVDITSEVGGTCTIANPWKGKACEVVSLSKEKSEKVEFQMIGNAIAFSTKTGCHYRVQQPTK